MQLSALHGEGVDRFWDNGPRIPGRCRPRNGQLAARRQQQALAWMWERIDAGLKQAFRQQPAGARSCCRELTPTSRRAAAGVDGARHAARGLASGLTPAAAAQRQDDPGSSPG